MANKDGYDDSLPPGKQPGWIVPKRLQKRWTLKLGSSHELLKKELETEPPLDMFIHDSEHSYDTMWFELNTAWNYLRDGGLLICDNIEANTSFFDFCRRIDKIPLVLPTPSEDRNNAPRFAIVIR